MVCIHPDARHHNTGLDAKTITNDHYTPKEDIQKMTREIFHRDMNTDVRRLWWRKMAGCDIEKPTNSKAGGYSETWLRVFKTEALPSITATKVRILTETAK